MPSQYERIAKIAERISADEPALSFTNFFGTQVESGLFDGPALLIGDDREIALRKERDAQAFEYRMNCCEGAEGWNPDNPAVHRQGQRLAASCSSR